MNNITALFLLLACCDLGNLGFRQRVGEMEEKKKEWLLKRKD